ncbi:integral membrane protein [Blastomyces dermatitidis ATCC 18188]|uniref:Integral membrane protein n=1 Tax=Ajellomyces dermatitidis (strain ATCC 18188 / CBS 674.68) TaxID=653446 RepID=F2TQW6_AJEDA|nr:integral membrane protein [Blastomyces dermatitidis ATCC 18188]EQL29652.1 hypothetical protein BDFG_07774 [Blastomyces dermatitidis ATCC 26199]
MANFGPTAPGHENRGWRLFVVTVVMIIVSGFFVVVRLSARYIRNGIRVDDWVIVAALTAAVGFSIAHVLAVQHGFGRHEHELTPQERIDALIWIFVAQVLYKVILCLTKTSIVLLYLRVFYAQKSFRWTCYVLIAFNIVSGIAFIPPTIWQCSPVHAFWDRSVPHRCIKNLANWLSYALINILTDVAILILPIRQVMHLQLRRNDKIAVIFVFALGGFVCITSIIRTTVIAKGSEVYDITWSPIPVSIWSTIEINTGIICACLPMIRQPLSILFPSLFSSSERSGSKQPSSRANNLRNRSQGRRTGEHSIPTNSSTPWARHSREEPVYMTAIKPRKDGIPNRTESEESMIYVHEISV